MNIRSTLELNEYLNSELGWRKRELTTAKFLIARVRQHQQEVAIRSSICLLYAHWEGFVKRACMAYLNYLSKQGLRQSDVTPGILAYCFMGRFRSVSETNKYTIVSDLVTVLAGAGNEPLSIPWSDVMSGQSNLNSVLLREIAHIVNIDYSDYAVREKLIDERLLRTRHAIAHGDQLSVDRTDYDDLHDLVIFLIDLFRNHVENAAVLQSFRRTAS